MKKVKKLLRDKKAMFGILKTVQNVATSENYNTVVNACGRVVAAVLPSGPEKVEAVNASKLRSFKKCDSSYTFSMYTDKPRNGTFYVVYVPRTLSIWRTRMQEEAELLRDQLNILKPLINALEKVNSKYFPAQLERLRDSVQKKPAFSDIHHAAACCFPRVIEKLYENRSNVVNEASVDGYLPLHIAVENESKEAVQVLLRLGADVAKQDCRSRNAVHYGAEKNPEILELLVGTPHFLDAVDAIDDDGLSPLCLAILSAKVECVEILLDAGCSTGPFPGGPLAAMVTVAVATSELPRIIDLLLKRAPNFLTEEINGSSTILHEKLDPKLLYHILGDVGDAVNADVRNGLGETPLYCAIARNDLTQSIALLANNADVDIANQEGDTPLHVAAKNGNVVLVKLLLCFGASVKARNEHGATALDVGKNSAEVMDCLRIFASAPSVSQPSLDSVLSESMQERALELRRQMTPDQRKQLINVVSLDGGGVKGLILLQILLHIEKLVGHSIMEHFHWLCGTSTGAIIALALAGGDTVRRCQGLYLRMKDEIFVGQRPYSAQIIEHFLQEHFGEKTTMAQLESKKVMVTASFVQTNPPVLRLFRNYTLPLNRAENKALGFGDPRESLIWKCARYSSAAPTFFPPKDNFVDGGLMANNPTLDLMSDIHTYNAACMKEEKEIVPVGCVLSLGTGQQPVEAIENLKWNFGLPRGITEGMSMFHELISLKNLLIEQITASNGACVNRARSWAHDQSIPFFRFSPQLSSQVELDETNNEIIVQFLWDTEKYLRTDGRHDVEALVKYLKSL